MARGHVLYPRRGPGLIVAAFLLVCTPAFALVLHQEGNPDATPPDAVLGRWGHNASCVVVDPNFVITTRHQNGGTGTGITIAGKSYVAAEVFSHPVADLRVVRVTRPDGLPANLREFVDVYSGTSERNRTAVLGGYGKIRGQALYTPDMVPYGYRWTSNADAALLWGANVVDFYTYRIPFTSYNSKGIRADYDYVGEDGYVPFEAAPAEWDSGGGWFINDDGRWKVIGLTAAVEHGGETWFRDPVTGAPEGDDLHAVRVGQYAEWIQQVISEFVLPGDANGDLLVNSQDVCILSTYYGTEEGATLAMGDFNGDGAVNYADLGILASNIQLPPAGSGSGVPEPFSTCLLASGSTILLLRRRR